MDRRIVALFLGLVVLGLFTTLFYFAKEAGIEVDRADDSAGQPAVLAIRIVASSSGEILLDGRPVKSGELADEVAILIADAAKASLPEPSFVIVVGEDADNVAIVVLMEALSQGGARLVSLETAPAD